MHQGAVPLGGLAVAVAAGSAHSVVLLVDGSVKAFGYGGNGGLGYGSTDSVGDKDSTLPLVLLDDGSVLAFGKGGNGRLGYGDTSDVGHTLGTLPSKQGAVSLGGNATAVAAGGEHSLVLLDDGSLLAFGKGGNGRLGYGDTSDVGHTLGTLPSKQGAVSLGGNATAVAAGGEHSLVLLDDGSLLAFGKGDNGKLGNGHTSDVGHTPETVPSKQSAVSLGGKAVVVAAGPSHSPVTLEDDTVLAVSNALGLVVGDNERVPHAHTIAIVVTVSNALGLGDCNALTNRHGLADAHPLTYTNPHTNDHGLAHLHGIANLHGIAYLHGLAYLHRQSLRFANRLGRSDRQHRQRRRWHAACR
ncbi:hypothetical protein FNF27_08036 [Cafeteria roenbergensis]|uniref:Uncharacterized protein n=1 Tax=Cafeteria roenbergensis TaxID=33653 RepID=A0A5A8DDR6_CAFRO|nr:hypothetical protein FNF27_08036 [Cafeteria roenbergensis]